MIKFASCVDSLDPWAAFRWSDHLLRILVLTEISIKIWLIVLILLLLDFVWGWFTLLYFFALPFRHLNLFFLKFLTLLKILLEKRKIVIKFWIMRTSYRLGLWGEVTFKPKTVGSIFYESTPSFLFDIVDDSIIKDRVVIETFLNFLQNIKCKPFFCIFLKNFSFINEICTSIEKGIVKREAKLGMLRNAFNIVRIISKGNNVVVLMHVRNFKYCSLLTIS